MSGGSKPETPESEKITQRHQARLGRQGTAIAARVGDKFVANATGSNTTRATGSASADAAIKRDIAMRKTRGNPTQVAKTSSRVSAATAQGDMLVEAKAVSDTASKKSQANQQALRASQSATNNGLRVATMQNNRNIGEMQEDFAKANQIVDIAAAVGSHYAANYQGNGIEAKGTLTNPNQAQPSLGEISSGMPDKYDPYQLNMASPQQAYA